MVLPAAAGTYCRPIPCWLPGNGAGSGQFLCGPAAAGATDGPQRHRAGRGGEVFQRFTDRARRVVVLAQEEARMLGHNYIGTEHILLGLIHEGEGVAAQVLVKLGADLNRVRQQVIRLLHGYQETEPQAASAGPRAAPSPS